MLMRVKMARSVFYYHLARLNDVDGHADMRKRIKAIYDENKGRYGYRRICMDLRNKGYIINHKTVRKLMSQISLKAKRKKRHYHSYKGQTGKIAPNIIDRDFSAERPNQKWTTDVSQVCIKNEKLYISPILDMYNREIITYTLSRSPNLKMGWQTCLERHWESIRSVQVWQYILIKDDTISICCIKRCSKTTISYKVCHAKETV